MAFRFNSSSSEATHSWLEARRIIQMKSIAAAPAPAPVTAENEGSSVAASTTGRVRETPVPPAMARMFVTSAFSGRRFGPYGPQRITGVDVVAVVGDSVWDWEAKTRFLRRPVSPLRHRAI